MYLNAYLGPCPGYGWVGGPEFKTRIDELPTGRERRNADWAQARHRYTAPFQNIRRVAYREIKRMHMACRGQLHAFRFRDVLDYQATAEPFGTGDGIKRVFQLCKFSVVDTIAYAREIYALPAAPVIAVGGVATTAFTIDLNRGIVTFSVAPASGALLTWTGIFDIWVRFNQDYLPFSLDNIDVTNGSVDLMEVPPPPVGT